MQREDVGPAGKTSDPALVSAVDGTFYLMTLGSLDFQKQVS